MPSNVSAPAASLSTTTSRCASGLERWQNVSRLHGAAYSGGTIAHLPGVQHLSSLRIRIEGEGVTFLHNSSISSLHDATLNHGATFVTLVASVLADIVTYVALILVLYSTATVALICVLRSTDASSPSVFEIGRSLGAACMLGCMVSPTLGLCVLFSERMFSLRCVIEYIAVLMPFCETQSSELNRRAYTSIR